MMVSGGGGCSGNFYDHTSVKVNMYLRSVTITYRMGYVIEHRLFFTGSVDVVFWSDWPITNPLASDLMERPCEAGMAGAFAVNVKGGQSWSMAFLDCVWTEVLLGRSLCVSLHVQFTSMPHYFLSHHRSSQTRLPRPVPLKEHILFCELFFRPVHHRSSQICLPRPVPLEEHVLFCELFFRPVHHRSSQTRLPRPVPLEEHVLFCELFFRPIQWMSLPHTTEHVFISHPIFEVFPQNQSVLLINIMPICICCSLPLFPV